MLHVFKHSNSYHTLRLPVIPGKRGKNRNRSRSPKGPDLRKHESRPMVRPHRSGSRNLSLLSPAGFTPHPGRSSFTESRRALGRGDILFTKSGTHAGKKPGAEASGVTQGTRGPLCPGTPLRGNKGEENDGEGEKNQCRARQLVGDMPSHCLNEREKEF